MTEVDESEVEDLVRRAIRGTYPRAQLEQDIDYVDVIYERRDQGTHVLRARAPSHELLAFERWMVVTIEGQKVHIRGAGASGPTEFYVHARIETD